MYENDKILGFHSEKLKDYRIIEEIGEGGSSHVYTAYYDKLMNQKRVIKVSKNIRNDDGSREAAILTSLHNPYIPIIYEYFIENDRAILIMEHIAGDSVQQKIKAGYLFSKDEVYKFGHQLCEVVTYLHSLPNPIIHGDIKPDNVIITPAGKVCLIDFNISGISHEGKAYTNGYTKGYGAPEQRDAFYELKQRRTSEQAKAGAKADRRSDTSGSQNNGTMPGTLDLYHLPDNIDPDKTFGVFGLSGRDNSEENKTVQLLGNELDNEGHEHTEMFSDPGKGTEFLGGASPDEQSLRTKSESIVVTGSDESISGYGIEIDKRSDVYSIGATLFRMYFCDKDKSINRIDRFRASGHKKVAGRGAHDGLLFVLDKALQDNPDKRYQTAQEMLDAIDKIKVGKKYGKFLGKIMPMSAIRTIFTGLAVVVIGGGTIAASSIGLFGSGSKADRDDKNRTKISSTSTSTPTAPNAEGSTEISAVEDEPDYRTALGKIETAKTFTDPDEARAKYVEALELLNTLKTNGYEKDPLLNTQIIYCHLYMDNLDAAKNVLAGIKDTLDSETRNEIENRIEIIENSKNIDKLLQLGAEYYDSKDYTSAKSAYESALEIDRNHQNANAGLIKTLIALGNLDLAKETAGRASFTDSAVKAEIDNLYSEQESAIAKRVKDADTAKKLKKITDDFPEYAEGYEKLIDHYIANETPNKKNGKLKDAESAIDKYQTNLGGLAAGAVLRLADKYIETNTVDSLARATDLIELHTGILEKDQSIAYLNKIQSSLENLNTPVDTPTPEPTPASTGGNTNKATQAPTATPTPKPTATPTPKPTATPTPTPAPLATFKGKAIKKIGSTIKFGKYDGSDITWIVYKVKGSKIYLISEYILTNGKFSDDGEYHWNSFNGAYEITNGVKKLKSDPPQINIWLNTKFLNGFTSSDQNLMVRPSGVYDTNENSQGIPERAYLLSRDEWKDVQKALGDDYDNLIGKTKGGKTSNWWLRDKYSDTDPYFVSNGKTSAGHTKADSSLGIRPAIIVKAD